MRGYTAVRNGMNIHVDGGVVVGSFGYGVGAVLLKMVSIVFLVQQFSEGSTGGVVKGVELEVAMVLMKLEVAMVLMKLEMLIVMLVALLTRNSGVGLSVAFIVGILEVGTAVGLEVIRFDVFVA